MFAIWLGVASSFASAQYSESQPESPWKSEAFIQSDLVWDSNVKRVFEPKEGADFLQGRESDFLVRLFWDARVEYQPKPSWSVGCSLDGGYKKFFKFEDEDLVIHQITPEALFYYSVDTFVLGDRLKTKNTRDRNGEFITNSAYGQWSHAWSPKWVSAVSVERQDTDFENRSKEFSSILEILDRKYDSAAWRSSLGLVRRFSPNSFLHVEYGFEYRYYWDYDIKTGETLTYHPKIDRGHRIEATTEYFDENDQWLIRAQASYTHSDSNLSGFDYEEVRVGLAWAMPLGDRLYLDLASTFDFREYSGSSPTEIATDLFEYIITEQESEQISSLSAQLTWTCAEDLSLHAQAMHYFDAKSYKATFLKFQAERYLRTLLDLGLEWRF